MEESQQKREVQRQKKAEYRARLKAISEGSYQPTPVELAKQFLEQMADPNIASVFEDETIGANLKPEDKKALQNFVYHLKVKRQREQQEDEKRIEEDRLISEKGRIFVNQKTYDLHQALLMTMSEDDRKSLIKETIDTNIFLFLEYMEGYQSPSNDFLEIVVGLQSQLEPHRFTDLFVRVCTYQKIDDLKVTLDMVKNAIIFLVEKKKDDKAAYGLLRLIYSNNISVTSFLNSILIKFQEDYEQTILRFFKCISPLESQVAESLPASAFCFTTPILRALREGGRVFFTQIPYQFMPYLIQIVCFSFTESVESFDQFIKVFKDGIMAHYNNLVLNRFNDLLQKILDETISMKSRFFGSLDFSAKVLEKAFTLLTQRQIGDFNGQVIHDLISEDIQVFQKMKQKPRIIPSNSVMKLRPLLNEIARINRGLNLDQYNLDRDLDSLSTGFFSSLGIESLLPIQVVCFNFCTSDKIQERFLVQLETGSGKTALSFTIACYYACLGLKVMVVNASKELTFRDYKKAESCTQLVNVQINFESGCEGQASVQDGITYLSFETLIQLEKLIPIEILSQTVVVCDEFDSIIFGSDEFVLAAGKIFPRLKKLFGLTGSDLKDYHVKAATRAIQGELIRMTIADVLKPLPLCHGIEVFPKVTDFREIIESLCVQQVVKTPIVIIADDEKNLLTRKLQRAGIAVEALYQKSFTESNGALMIFLNKQADKYPVFIVNDSQGRGLDFPSSTEIEENGGIYVVIAKLPSSYLQFKQFLGRTGRIGNKAQYSVVLHDPEAKNEDGESYLQKKLETLQNIDIHRLSSDLYKAKDEIIKPGSNSKEEEKHVDNTQSNQHSLSNAKSPHELDLNIYPEQSSNTISGSSGESNDLSVASEGLISCRGLRKRDRKAQEKESEYNKEVIKTTKHMREKRDYEYFKNYGQIEIHEEMCADQVRVAAYKTAIQATCGDKTVVDVGAGSGILAIAAAEAGAKKVYAIEKASIHTRCKREVNKRNLGEIIKVMNCLAEEAPIEDVEADVILSEWMGFFLLFERMLPSVLQVRDRCLKRDGVMIPGRVRIIIAAGTIPDQKRLVFSGQDCGIMKMEAVVSTIPKSNIISSHAVILDQDLKLAPAEFDSFESLFSIKLEQEGLFNALVSWFEVEMTKDVWLSTSPFEPPTHWEQTSFPLMGIQSSPGGQEVKGEIKCRPRDEDHRGVEISITLQRSLSKVSEAYSYFIE